MGSILGNWRITLAALFSVVVIIGAYLLARGVESPRAAEASTESALLQAIATKDSDGDGLSDWEEALYGTDSHITDSFGLGMSDRAAVEKGLIVPKAIADIKLTPSSPSELDSNGLPPPADETLTAAFAQHFFSLYLSTKEASGSTVLSENDVANVAIEAVNALSSMVVAAPDFTSIQDLTISGSGPDALRAFAVNAEAVLLKNTATATTNELIYLQYALENNDTEALSRLASIAKAYRDSAVGLKALTVPTELATGHLALVNAMVRVSEIVSDFARVNDDPLTAMLALQQYVPAAQALGQALIDIGNVYAVSGITFPRGTPGASFVNIIAGMMARQQAAPTL